MKLEGYSIEKDRWEWVTNNEQKFLQSGVLKKNNFRHAFFTKYSTNYRPEQLAKNISNSCGIYRIKQVHGSDFLEAFQSEGPPWPQADGLISNKGNQSLWIYSADCIPVLIASKKSGRVSACHAGWKGVAKRIVIKVIDNFEKFGDPKEEILVALGPAISLPNYQVELDVAASVCLGQKNCTGDSLEIFRKEMKKFISKKILSFERSSNKFYLDIRLAVANQLTQSGIRPSNISICQLCTFSERSLFHSWRRDQKRNIQWSMIISNNHA